MSDSRLAEIEEILQGPPSRFAFRLLRALIDDCPDHNARDTVIRGAERVLKRWPARTRHVEARYGGPMSALLRSPSWPLARSLRWTAMAGSDGEEISRAIADLASDPHSRHLLRLMLENPDDEVLQLLPMPTCFPNLVRLSLELGCDNQRRTVIPLLISGLPASLRHLTLENAENLDDGISGDVPEIIDAIASSPVGRRLRAVRLPNMSDATLAHFLGKFRRPLSDIGHQTWTIESLGRLLHHRALASGLKRLNLQALNVGLEGVSLLARCPHLGRLEQLNLGGNSVGPEEAAVLAGSSLVSNLKALELFDNPLGDEGWKILGRAPFRRLRVLDLGYTEATALGARFFARSRSLDSLRSLVLNGNPMGDEGASEILAARFAARLRRLDIAATGKSAATAAAVASRPLERLRTLDLGSDRGGPEFGRQLARSSVFPSLLSLDLQGLWLGDEGVAHLAKATGFPRLQRLSLWGNDLTSRGVRSLAESPFVSSIRELSLRSNPEIDDEGALALARSPYIENLIGLDLDHGWNRVSREGLDSLRRAPNLRLLGGI